MTGTTTAVRTSRTPKAIRLVRSELQKIRTVNLWWIFALVLLGTTAFTFFINAIQSDFLLSEAPQMVESSDPAESPGQSPGLSEEEREAVREVSRPSVIAANLYTSGQFLNLLIVLAMGIIAVTGEFHHKIVSTTFLVTPHRTAVIVAKAVATSVLAVVYWALSTAINVPLTAAFLQAHDLETYLADPEVVQAILLNLAAYVLWAVLGVGFGVLLRSQIAATVVGIVLYFAGFVGGFLIFSLLADWLNADWILELMVGIPSYASQVMVSGAELPGDPERWVGALVLIGWAAVAGAIGILITRRRDVT